MKDLQQIKDEYAYEAGFADWNVLECYGEDMDKHVDQIAIRYAQEVNKELVEMLESMENAWQKLPYGHNSVKDTQNWITNDIHPQILRMREYVRKHKGGKS